MLLAYPAHCVKVTIMLRKATDLVWSPNKTTMEIHSAVMEYYEAYDRAVVQTRGLADVTMIVQVQDWRHASPNCKACSRRGISR
jgi:hypothetical protein